MTGIGTGDGERNGEKKPRNGTVTEVAMSIKDNTRNGTKTSIEFES